MPPEKKTLIPRPVTPRAHGLVDYALLGVWAGVPRLLGLPRRVRTVFQVMGLAQVGLNAVTDQPYALRRLVPFRVHGEIEKYSGPLYIVLPLVVGAWRDPRSRAFHLVFGAVLLTNFNLTNWWDSPTES
ncbi:hypothetical protein [Corynebacterium halotolerans]|uniref:Integral membrane protein n=1 Tax=Corynebacterium halotolerans YIM 70093 = DSM 44683 TaxID=1121362 RepID=M1MU14_9CORY|nr:hypothetical protein [Corynebacterium halotolerans]AGF71199.1 hypothetical protein A605_00915 [Corynebacterium halotolerans YIM 70093 = DSM 44683]